MLVDKQDNTRIDEVLKYLYQGLNRLPYPPYEMSETAKLYVSQLWIDPMAAQIIVEDMLAHLGLPAENIRVAVDFLPDMDPSEVGGLFQKSPEGNTLTFHIKKRFHAEHILSIMAHECCHHLLHTYNLQKSMHADNEFTTDICTVFCGFYEIMKAGYTPTKVESITKDDDGKEHTHTSLLTVGYVTVAQLEYTQNRINEELSRRA